MKRLSLWLLFFAVLGIQSVLAQTYTVKGNVVSKTDNEPLIGVSILQKGTTNGVITDIDDSSLLLQWEAFDNCNVNDWAILLNWIQIRGWHS